jgi:pimeloyl-ACP methyl ester carboxylesterase
MSMRVPRSLAIVAAAIAAATLSSALYQEVAAGLDRRRFPAPGRMVDVGGCRLHLLEAGEGLPAAVVVPALGDTVLVWTRIQRALAREIRVCVYDRAGIGWSDSPPRGRRTPDGLADELHALLTAAGIPLPCIVVAHSFGGIVARHLATRYPGAVAGLVLIESSHESQAVRHGVDGWPYGRAAYCRRVLRRQLSPLGLRRLAAARTAVDQLGADVAREVEPENVAAQRAILLSTRQRRNFVRETLMLARLSGPPRRLGSLPLTVITAGEPLPGWMPMQRELAALSADSTHIIADGCRHYVHLDDPELVLQAIRDMVRKVGQH